jgi:hypothetical protein
MELHEINVEVLSLFSQSKSVFVKNEQTLKKAQEYFEKAEKLKKELANGTYDGAKKVKSEKVKNILTATWNFLNEKITKYQSTAATQAAKQELLEQKRAENTARLMGTQVEQEKAKEQANEVQVPEAPKEEKQEEVEAKKKPGKSRK